jgi:hypothetical protein
MALDIRKVEINGEEREVLVGFDYPPIPIRNYDYHAVDYNTYDGAEDSHCPIGHGATAEEAINDLKEQMES